MILLLNESPWAFVALALVLGLIVAVSSMYWCGVCRRCLHGSGVPRPMKYLACRPNPAGRPTT